MSRAEARQEVWAAVRQGFLRGLWHGAVLGVAIVLPFKIAFRADLGPMLVGSAIVVLATGVLLAHKMKMYPFTEKRDHW